MVGGWWLGTLRYMSLEAAVGFDAVYRAHSIGKVFPARPGTRY